MSTEHTDHTATLLSTGRVLVVGGISNGSMVTPRSSHTATRLFNGLVLVTGGQSNTADGLASTELYNPVRNTWFSGKSMAVPRTAHTATLLLNGLVLTAGGADDERFLTSAELYIPASVLPANSDGRRR